MPKVTVIIPTYNHRDFILATLDSVFAQTFNDYEVIVVNDGSQDDTADVLKPLAQAGRIRYIEQANQGQASARNRGLAEAKGEYIAFIDDDDTWPSDKLGWQIGVLEAHPGAGLVYGCAHCFGGMSEFIYPGGNGPYGWVRDAFLQRNWIISPGQTLIRRSHMLAVDGYDHSLWGVDDWDLYVRLATQGEFVYSERVALHYRQHSANASKNTWRMYINACSLQRKHYGRIPRPRSLRSWLKCRLFIWECFYPATLYSAQTFTLNSDWRNARKMWWRAVQMKPQILRKRNILQQVAKSIIGGYWCLPIL